MSIVYLPIKDHDRPCVHACEVLMTRNGMSNLIDFGDEREFDYEDRKTMNGSLRRVAHYEYHAAKELAYAELASFVAATVSTLMGLLPRLINESKQSEAKV